MRLGLGRAVFGRCGRTGKTNAVVAGLRPRPHYDPPLRSFLQALLHGKREDRPPRRLGSSLSAGRLFPSTRVRLRCVLGIFASGPSCPRRPPHVRARRVQSGLSQVFCIPNPRNTKACGGGHHDQCWPRWPANFGERAAQVPLVNRGFPPVRRSACSRSPIGLHRFPNRSTLPDHSPRPCHLPGRPRRSGSELGGPGKGCSNQSPATPCIQ